MAFRSLIRSVSSNAGQCHSSRPDFAARLAGKFLLDGHKNVVFSPASIHAVVGLIAAGATDATLDQTLDFLSLKKKEEIVSMYQKIVRTTFADGSILGGPRLCFVNGVWLDQSMELQKPFKEIACGAFKAFAQEVDFQSRADQVREEVNLWAEKKTKGLIKDLLPYGSVDATSRLILANALYFKGSWVEKFDAAFTKEDDFHTLDGKTVRVPFMTSRMKQYLSAFDGFKVLKLSYKQGVDTRSFSMIIFLPDAKDGLKSLIERMCSEPGFLGKYIPVETVRVGDFMIPKFEIGYQLELSRDLRDMGLNLPFDQLGGLMEMVTNQEDGKWLFVSNIFHKSFIEVNEEGTKAAAATASMKGAGCARRRPDPEIPLDFVADHPFAFVIKRDFTDDVLFLGEVVNPL